MPFKAPPGVFRRCPKCKSFRVLFDEHLTMMGEWIQDEAGIKEECIFHGRGQTGRVNAVCRACGHFWRPRGFNRWMLNNR